MNGALTMLDGSGGNQSDGSRGGAVEPQRDSRQSMADDFGDDIAFVTMNAVW
jgi:hypothetical protein